MTNLVGRGLRGSALLGLYGLASSPRYWALRARVDGIVFRLARAYHGATQRLTHTQEAAVLFSHLLASVAGGFVYALAVGLLLTVLDYRVQLPLRFWEFIPAAFAKPQFDTLLGTIVQIDGVFLGLYFTALTVVAGSTYATAPPRLRSIFLNQKVGTSYIRSVTRNGALGVVALTLSASGYPSQVLAVVVACHAVVVLLGAVGSGGQALLYFDATLVSNHVAERLGYAIRRATHGFGARSAAFQDYYRRVAAEQVAVLKDLSDLAAHQEQHREKLLRAWEVVFSSLLSYGGVKSRIPGNSRWFRYRYAHRSWIAGGLGESDISRQLSASLTPRQEPDLDWFESELGECSEKLGRVILGDERAAVDALARLPSASHELASNWRGEEAVVFAARLRRLIIGHVADQATPRETVAATLCVDAAVRSALAISAGTRARLSARSAQESVREAAKLVASGKAIHVGIEPRAVTRALEDLAECLKFERLVDGAEVTASWYRLQIVAAAYVSALWAVPEGQVSDAERAFGEELEPLSGLDDVTPYACALSVAFECVAGLEGLVADVQGASEELNVFRVEPTVRWPAKSANDLKPRIEAIRRELVRRVGGAVSRLATGPRTRELPDYLGQFQAVLGEQAVRALAAGDAEGFAAVFEPFFAASIALHDRVEKELPGLSPRDNAILKLDILNELLDLSGYAYLRTQLSNAPAFWDATRGVWDGFLGAAVPGLARYFVEAPNGRRRIFVMSDRGIVRTRWAQSFASAMAASGLKVDPFNWRPVKHANSAVRAFSASLGYFHAAEVFVAVHLLSRPDGQGAEAGAYVHEFVERMQEAGDGDAS